MFATSVNNTGGKWKKSSIWKILIILFGHLWVVEETYIKIFAFKFTFRCLQPDIVPIICHRCRWYPWQFATGVNNTRRTGGKICRRCRWYRWQICRRCCWYRRQFATGVFDTGDKFATGVNDTGDAPWLANISANFRKNSKWSYCYCQGLGGKMIHEKNLKQKILWHCRFKCPLKTPATAGSVRKNYKIGRK